jgi:hypothetical protein
MRFANKEIEMARQLRQLGLRWQPRPGHYVYDEAAFCRKGSPFQDRVYFILNYDYFMNQVGGVERFKEIMLWLPNWHDARQILRSLGVSDNEVAAGLQRQNAIEEQTELLALYEMIANRLQSDHRPVPQAAAPAASDSASGRI